MATALDTKFRALSTSMLAKFGKSITYRRLTVGTGPQPTNTTADTTVKAMIVGASLAKLVPSTTLVDGKKVIVAAADLAFDPSPSDKLVIDAVVHQIATVKPIWSGELVAAVEMLVGVAV